MTSTLAKTEAALQRNRSALNDMLRRIKGMANVDDLQEVRANTEGVKAWAKVHGRIKEIRLDLLSVEVEALVRVYELGGANTLNGSERKAAEYLASLTPEARTALVADSGNVTTVGGMLRSIWQEQELNVRRDQMREAGIRLATRPGASGGNGVRSHSADVAAALSSIIDNYTTGGQPFTVEDIADDLIEESGATCHADDEPTIREGVREVCRSAVRKAPVVSIDGTVLPRFVTACADDGAGFVRVPVENALLSHLDEMRALRREQLAQDQAALDRLDKAAAKLRAIPGATDESRIGALVAQSVTPNKRSA